MALIQWSQIYLLTANFGRVVMSRVHVEERDNVEEEAGGLNGKDKLSARHEYSSNFGDGDSALVDGHGAV